MSDNVQELLEFIMSEMGETKISENVIISAMEYIEDSSLRESSAENEEALDELQDLLCQHE